MAMHSMSVSTTHTHIHMHHNNSIHTCCMFASYTHKSLQQPSLLLICFFYEQLQTRNGRDKRRSKTTDLPGHDGNQAHFEMIEVRTPTTRAVGPSKAVAQLAWGQGLRQRAKTQLTRPQKKMATRLTARVHGVRRHPWCML